MSDKKTIEITQDTIKKAYETLGVSVESSSLEKAEVEKDEDEDKDEEKEKGMRKGELESLIAKQKEDLRKSEEELNALNGAKTEKVEKSESSSIEKAILNMRNEINEKFTVLGQLNKSLRDQLEETQERLEKAEEDLSKSAGRKSIVTKQFIEKAFQENENGDKVLSIRAHKNEIQRLLIEKSGFSEDVIEKSQVNEFWKNEMEYFEATGGIRPRAAERLLKENKIQIVL